MIKLLNLGQMNLPWVKLMELKDYNEWEYESKKCPKCKDGIIGESEGGDYANTMFTCYLKPILV